MIEESKKEVTKQEIKKEDKAVACVIAKNQLFDICSFIDHQHIVTLKIRSLSRKHSIWVDLEDPCLNQLRRKVVEVSVKNIHEARDFDFEKFQRYSLDLTISSPFLITMAKKLRDMKVGKMNLNYEESSSNDLLIRRLSELKDQSYLNGLDFLTYKLSVDGNT